MPMQLDGPGLAPLAGGKAAYLVILLHGVGANGNDLIALARAWRTILPEGEFIAPNAPLVACRFEGSRGQFSIGFSMNSWLTAGSATPAWRSRVFRKAPPRRSTPDCDEKRKL